MCRLFAFRSNVPARVHPSLVEEKNSLKFQSNEHKDGWGIAYYNQPFPELAHGIGPAHADPEFERVSNLLASHTVLAHVRLASVGPVSVENAHPFQYGTWTFAHNGTVNNFNQCQQRIERNIRPEFLSAIRGDTDSERCFYFFLSHLRKRTSEWQEPTLQDVTRALAQTIRCLIQLADLPHGEPSSLNFIVTNGKVMAASRRHRTLFFSEWKKKKDTSHQEPTSGTLLRQIVISSEKVSSEDHWHEVYDNEIIGVDETMCFTRSSLEKLLF